MEVHVIPTKTKTYQRIKIYYFNVCSVYGLVIFGILRVKHKSILQGIIVQLPKKFRTVHSLHS